MQISTLCEEAKDVTFRGNYICSHCQGNYSDINQNGPPANETYTKPGDRNFDNGNCLSDRRQIFNATAIAQTPKFSKHTMQTLASDWTVSESIEPQAVPPSTSLPVQTWR